MLVILDSCLQYLVKRWHLPGRKVLKSYGPTYATVPATLAKLHPAKPVTIGGPLPTYSIVILAESPPVYADLLPLIITVTPEHLTEDTPVTVAGLAWFGDPGQEELETTYNLTDYHIDIDVFMADLHSPGSYWTQVMTLDGGLAQVGTLPQGQYDVDVSMWMWMYPWGGSDATLIGSGHTTFEVLPGPLIGDADHDGLVSADDYASIQAHFGDTGDPGILGDANWDGFVSADADTTIGIGGCNFGCTLPEPTTLALLGMGLVAILRRRKLIKN